LAVGSYSCSIGKGIGKLPLRTTISLGKKFLNCPREQPSPRGRKGLKVPHGTTMFLREQMCLKLCVLVIFSYEF